MKHFITGINGFAGSHLADLLTAQGQEVFGLVRPGANRDNLRPSAGRVRLLEGDVRDAPALEKILGDVRPDRIYHLAAVSFVPQAVGEPQTVWATNVEGTRTLLECVRGTCPQARVLWVGSSEEYGVVGEGEVPIRETQPLHPVSTYGQGKLEAERIVEGYAGRLDVVRARAFNHTGPRQSERFLCSAFAKQAAAIAAGAEATMRVGNLEVFRDFTDVRDTVRAYALLLAQGARGEVYNVCSGRAVKVSWVLARLLGEAGREVRVEVDPARYRPEPATPICGDCGRLTAATGWRPEIGLERTLRELFEFWREKNP